MTVCYIGGSPCSGKSTIAQALAQRHGLHYFKVDDHLSRYISMAAEGGRPCCARIARMSPEEIWMREPQVQCDEEVQIYREIFDYVMADLSQISAPRGVITEGAAFLPDLIHSAGIPCSRYVAITPDKAFQVEHYRRREWVPCVLEGCSDKEKAFANWMERDALFARTVQQQCDHLGYTSLIQRGDQPAEAWIRQIETYFRLG